MNGPAWPSFEVSAAAGHFDVVIVHAIDRLYRKLERLLKVLQGFQQHGIAFVSITENLDFTTPWGKLALAVLGTLAEIYIDRLSAETSKGKHQRAREGLWNGSIPLGYCSGKSANCTDPNGANYCPHFGGPDQGDGKKLALHPVEREAVRLAFEWYVTGDFSDGDIAEKLNATCHRLPDGHKLPLRPKSEAARNGPGIFTKDTLREVLVRVFYTGMVPYYGVDGKGRKRKRKDPVALYPGQHPALVGQELFDQAQEMRRLLGANPRQHAARRRRVCTCYRDCCAAMAVAVQCGRRAGQTAVSTTSAPGGSSTPPIVGCRLPQPTRLKRNSVTCCWLWPCRTIGSAGCSVVWGVIPTLSPSSRTKSGRGWPGLQSYTWTGCCPKSGWRRRNAGRKVNCRT